MEATFREAYKIPKELARKTGRLGVTIIKPLGATCATKADHPSELPEQVETKEAFREYNHPEL